MKKYLLLGLILILAYMLRLPLLSGSFWLDESAQVLESMRPLSEQHNIPDDFQPPLLHYIVHFMLYLGSSEWWLRQVSVLSGIGTIFFVYKILEEKHQKSVAILASLFLSTSSFHIFFSQELRPYSLATFFATLSWYALTKCTKDKKQKLWFVLFVVSSLGGLYSMYVYPFILLAQIVWTVWTNALPVKKMGQNMLMIFLGGLPWVVPFFGQLTVGTSLQTALPGWSQAVAVPQIKALPLTLAKFFTGQVELDADPLRIAIFTLPILLFFWASYRLRNNPQARLYLIWFFLPVIGAWILSFFIPIIAPKRLMVSLPALWIILALFIHKQTKDTVRKVLIIGVLLLNLGTTALYYTNPLYQRENWRGLIQDTEESAPSSSVALFAFPDAFAPWYIYATDKITPISTKKLRVLEVADLPTDFSVVQNSQTVYVFDYLRDLTDPNRVIESWLTMQGYSQTRLIDGKQIGFVRVFSR